MNNRKQNNIIQFTGRSQNDKPMKKLGSMLLMKQPEGPAPDDFFWTCEKCGPIEPLALPTGRWIKRTCQCQRNAKKTEQEQLEHASWLQKTRIRTFGGWLGERWEDEEIVTEMCNKTFKNFQRDRQSEAYEKAWKFAQNPQGNLLLCGGYGTGKTHLEAAICNYLREAGRLMSDGTRRPMSSLFTSAPQFFRAYNDAMNATDKTKFVCMTDQAIGTPLLVIDDVDKAKPTDFRMDTYFLILDERYKAKRPTILSTNREDNLADYIGEAVAFSRFMRKLEIAEMVGADYRLEEEL